MGGLFTVYLGVHFQYLGCLSYPQLLHQHLVHITMWINRKAQYLATWFYISHSLSQESTTMARQKRTREWHMARHTKACLSSATMISCFGISTVPLSSVIPGRVIQEGFRCIAPCPALSPFSPCRKVSGCLLCWQFDGQHQHHTGSERSGHWVMLVSSFFLTRQTLPMLAKETH